MSLINHTFEPYYTKEETDIAKDFYLPCMASSTMYDRATGYFGSTVYLLSWSCLKQFVDNGGHMRILCSPYLSEADQAAIEEGVSSQSSEEQKERLFNEFRVIYDRDELTAPERVLACLISMNIIEIKIAVGRNDVNRLFHDKEGIFSDGVNHVAFRGSINETFKGISDDGNFESFDVFTSWGAASDIARLNGIKQDFEKVWNNQSSTIQTIELPSSIKQLIKKHAIKQSHWTEALDEVTATLDKSNFWTAEKRNGGRKPREHQVAALEKWVANGKKGILEHATGSGKTFTAMCAIGKELEANHPIIILVPSVGLLSQWIDELNYIFEGVDINILKCGDGDNKWKQKNYIELWTKPNSPEKRIIVSTMTTASSDEFIRRIIPSSELFVVADEVHRMGSAGNRNFFRINAGIRLGLSATPRRYGDELGTQALINYFGGILKPPFTLKDAIDNGVLTKYFYHPEVVQLSQNEQEQWDDLSIQITKQYAILSNTNNDAKKSTQSLRLQTLLLKRASICKNASGKLDIAIRILQENYKAGQRWIVYCDNQNQLNTVLSLISSTGIPAYEYHSQMDGDKVQTLKYFSEIGGVIVSIRCLDEGIDIPETTHALILASSQNPREYIQRRGRILRRHTGKNYAYLYDTIVIPNGFMESDKHAKIIQTELSRAIQFGEWASDPSCIVHLKLIANEHNMDLSLFENTGIENENE